MDNKDDNIFEQRKILADNKSNDGEKLYEVKKNSEGIYEHGNKTKSFNQYDKIRKVMSIFIAIFIAFISFNMIIGSNNIVITIFGICMMLVGLIPLAQAFDKDIIITILAKLYLIFFFTLWFVAVGIATYSGIKNNNMVFVLFTIPFWLIGIFIVLMFFIRKKK